MSQSTVQPTHEARIHPLVGERLLSFAAAARLLPSRAGGHVHASTLWRWCTSGACRPGGGRVRLERVRIGGTWFTSAEAISRFLAKLSAEPDRSDVPLLRRTPAQRRRGHERASRELDNAGI
jgi:hypothetical protein